MKTRNYFTPDIKVCRILTEQGFAISADSGLPSLDDDWTNNDFE